MELRRTGAACVFEGMLPAGAPFALSNNLNRVLFVEVDGSLRWLDLRGGDSWPFTASERVRAAVASARPRSLRACGDGCVVALARGREVALVRPDADDVVTLHGLPEDAAVIALLDHGGVVVTESHGASRVWLHDGHTGAPVRAFEGAPAAVSLCGRYLAVASHAPEGGHVADVWLMDGGGPARRVTLPRAPGRLSFSGGGFHLWGAARDGGGRVWRSELATGRVVAAALPWTVHAISPRPYTGGVVLVDDRGSVLSADARGDVVVSERLAESVSGHGSLHAAASPDGRTVALVTGGFARRVDVVAPHVLDGRAAPALAGAVAASHDGRAVAVASGREVCVLDAASLTVRWRLEGHAEDVRDLAFVPGGALVSLGVDGWLRAWNLAAGIESWSLMLPRRTGYGWLTVSPCGGWAAVYVGAVEGTAFVDLRVPAVRETVPGVVAFLPDEPRGTAASYEARATAPHLVVRVVDVERGRVLDAGPTYEESDLTAGMAVGLDRVVFPSRGGRAALVFRTYDYEEEEAPEPYLFHCEGARALPCPADLNWASVTVGERRVAALYNPTGEAACAVLYDLDSGDEVARSEPFAVFARPASVALSHDERVVFVADRGGRLYRYELLPRG